MIQDNHPLNAMGTSLALLSITQGDAKLSLPVCQEGFLPWENLTGQIETQGQNVEY